MAEVAVEAPTILVETVGEAAEDMSAAEETITEEVMVDVAIMIMATIEIETIIAMPASSQPWVVNKIEINRNPTNREAI